MFLLEAAQLGRLSDTFLCYILYAGTPAALTAAMPWMFEASGIIWTFYIEMTCLLLHEFLGTVALNHFLLISDSPVNNF